MLKLAIAGAMALALPMSFALGDPIAIPAEQTYDHPYVKQVMCEEGRGSAFMIEGGKFVSVNHVTRMTNCKIDGTPFIVDYADPVGDFSILTVPGQRGAGIKISCKGYEGGGIYYALGYARGNPWGTAVTLRADSFATFLWGRGVYAVFAWVETVIPGQSGAPIVDSSGTAHGTVNAYNSYAGLSWSRPLSETPLCGAAT